MSVPVLLYTTRVKCHQRRHLGIVVSLNFASKFKVQNGMLFTLRSGAWKTISCKWTNSRRNKCWTQFAVGTNYEHQFKCCLIELLNGLSLFRIILNGYDLRREEENVNCPTYRIDLDIFLEENMLHSWGFLCMELRPNERNNKERQTEVGKLFGKTIWL